MPPIPPNVSATGADQTSCPAPARPGQSRRLSQAAGSVPLQLALFPEQVSLARIRERNERRYYRLEIVTDLFGTVGLARTWGRIGRSARSRFDPLPDLGSALDALRQMARSKRRRGYQDISGNSWL